LHFDACRPEYENMVKTIGIRPGWRVLDAGCGNGRFLGILSELATYKGELYAIDLASENIDAVKSYIKQNCFVAPVIASVGNVSILDFPDNYFDLVWCANVTQYLDKDGLDRSISEFKRVLKPGGAVAIKETDGSSYFFYPTKSVSLLWDTINKMNKRDIHRWFIHPIEMKQFLSKVGFIDAKQTTHLIERRFPLDEMSQRYLAKLFELEDVNWSAIDRQTPENQREWRKIMDKNLPEYILSQPNFFWREGHILATGIKL